MRIHLFEFEDQHWFPSMIREGGTDYLRYLLNFLNFYHPVIPILNKGLHETGEKRVLDLCSGGGGPIEQIQNKIDRQITFVLSDLYPSIQAYQYLKNKTNGAIDFIDTPVNAKETSLPGFRTMFSAIHHFKPDEAKRVLQNAVENKSGIAIFDGGNKNILLLPGIIIFHLLAFLIFTPFFRPFRFSRLFFTYVLPFIPLYTIWDGMVSILRLYTPEQLLRLTKDINSSNYLWKSGKLKSRYGLQVTWLIGYPITN